MIIYLMNHVKVIKLFEQSLCLLILLAGVIAVPLLFLALYRLAGAMGLRFP